ncbi:MAG: acetyl-CoA carboxylase biotin carboxyl carrier protein subunit [Lutibacter sp.]|uniref:acetyl-CoA carboxylase biotin carboxyl carrier protein subunit n=1 Tax=Lutibacter sp. TaxID=1925666 RepID=UPI0017D6A031|nr:acetyl-CoA carboxylase biotin carboxyl carrier protein subunit [Lutibacter sp.]MBT8317624.1 acetyl-CoA carboxylase biotin carboxyl carrier protein subunit [Lutibacter sp.]NNJ58483.1 acetyl-CoA carboxylase biotin carboxyl carrier protein subunit [Lutibacter sp.]
MNQNYTLKVNETFDFNFTSSDTKKLDVLKLSTSKFHVINNSKSFHIQVLSSNFLKKEYTLRVNSNNYTVKISNELDTLIKEMGFSLGSAKIANDIKAPMPGLILSINVKVGQQVKEGESLLILEAMKMENSIGSPKDGIVKSIQVKNGKTVEKGTLLIELE